MKRIIAIFVFTALLIGSLVGCSETPVINEDKLSVVTTIFPEYDWVKQILGEDADNAELTMLLDNGVDLHSYQPTADDIISISTCDMFIYVGGESDKWVESALKEATNKDMVVINLLDVLGDAVKEEEIAEGMEGEDDDEEAEEEGPEYDEHVWLSLKNAKLLCLYIADKLSDIDSSNAETYKANAASYVAELDTLDSEYRNAVNGSDNKTILFGDRFPFRYLADDYGLTYYAAFVGCSAETEASFETITFLSEKTDEPGLHCVLTLEGTNHKIAETIVSNTKTKDQSVLTMDSMQSTTMRDVKNGTTYLSVMRNNLEVLKKALS